MSKKRRLLFTVVTGLVFMMVGTNANANSSSEVFFTDLNTPTKIILTQKGNLLVAEAGDPSSPNNTGRISFIDRDGYSETLLDGLPSGPSVTGEPSGPSGLALHGRTLYIAIGIGDVLIFGPAPGTEIPNPDGPSSPILSSVLKVHFSKNVDKLREGFTLAYPDDHFRLANGFSVTLENTWGDRANVSLLADFRNLVPDPTTIVRGSNPFGLALAKDDLFVVDAGMNSVVRVYRRTGSIQTLVRFQQLDNTAAFPPFIDAVPVSIRLFGHRHRHGHQSLLVPLLSGFPWPTDVAEVRKIDIRTPRHEPFIDGESFITGLTMAIDVLPAPFGQFFVLEFGPGGPGGGSGMFGRLLRFASPSAMPEVILEGLTSPTSMARDPMTGELFITEIFTGQIIRVEP